MATYEVKVTWTLRGTNDAACVGNDETATIEAESARKACEEAADDHIHHHADDWNTGRYDLVAECGEVVYGVEFCEA